MPRHQPNPAPEFSETWAALLAAATPSHQKQLLAAARKAGESFTLNTLKSACSESQASTLQDVARAASAAARDAQRAEAGQRHRERMAERSRENYAATKEIGPLPEVVDPERRESCRLDLPLFGKTYFPEKFTRPYSDDELHELESLQTSITDDTGGIDIYVDPRGSGKSTRCETAVIWATVYGHSLHTGIIPASDEMAADILAGIESIFETNELLYEDFPEICHPIRCLEGHHNRAKGQTLNGERTQMRFTKKKIVFPTIDGSPSSGAILFAAGLESAVRGTRHHRQDGTTSRPRLLFVDDPQTRETAESEQQTNKRERILTGDLMGCGPSGGHLTVEIAATVIADGDLTQRLLDRNRHPQIRQHKHKLLYEFPTDFTADASAGHWDTYFEMIAEDLRKRGCRHPFARATKYYAANRKAMDKGAVIGNPHRFNQAAGELSALQHAMNLYFKLGAEAFSAEYNNEPLQPGAGDIVPLNAAAIATKLSNYARCEVPPTVQWITAFVDVHARVLYWMVCGWEPDFTGYILDYSVWPKPGRSHFTQDNARPSLQQLYPKRGPSGAIYAGLRELTDDLCSRKWKRRDGATLRLNRMLIDAGFAGRVVRKVIRESKHGGLILPSFGRFIGADEVPISEFRPKPGELISPDEWLVRGRAKAGLHAVFDANVWKTHAANGLTTQIGDPGSIAAYGIDPKKERHDFLSEHLVGEKRERVKGRRRECDVWTAIPGRQNHFWDDLVGNLVAASMCGAKIGGAKVPKLKKAQRERVSYL